jgi:hypothetical protein
MHDDVIKLAEIRSDIEDITLFELDIFQDQGLKDGLPILDLPGRGINPNKAAMRKLLGDRDK